MPGDIIIPELGRAAENAEKHHYQTIKVVGISTIVGAVAIASALTFGLYKLTKKSEKTVTS